MKQVHETFGCRSMLLQMIAISTVISV